MVCLINTVCRLGDGKEYLFQAKDEVRSLNKILLKLQMFMCCDCLSCEVKYIFPSQGGNGLLDPLHPWLHSSRIRRLTWRSTGTQPRHDDASHLPRLR